MTTTPLPVGQIKIAEGGPRLTVTTPPIVEIKDYVNVCGYSIPAKFDLSGVSPKHHQLVLGIILTGKRNIYINA